MKEPVQTTITHNASCQKVDPTAKVTSFFEFWPTWVMYLPVVVQWLGLSIRYRSLTLPLIANPNITLAGMVGGSKAEVFSQAQGSCIDVILPWILYTKTTQPLVIQAEAIIVAIQKQGIKLPFVCKPDMGCRGAGVKLIKNNEQLLQALDHYPIDSGIIIQKLACAVPEAGIFYVREPKDKQGRIVSLAFKDSPVVTGDGVNTIEALIRQDVRARSVLHLYHARHHTQWLKVLPFGEIYPLIFSASHCRGAVFTDARRHITPKLTEKIDLYMQNIPNFYYGRLDVKYKNLDSLENGEDLEIIEINGASSESIHIWDKNTPFLEAIRALLWQYRTLFAIGDVMRSEGHNTPSPLKLYNAWRHESRLTALYPETD